MLVQFKRQRGSTKDNNNLDRVLEKGGKILMFLFLAFYPLIIYPVEVENRLRKYDFAPLTEDLFDTVLYGKMLFLFLAAFLFAVFLLIRALRVLSLKLKQGTISLAESSLLKLRHFCSVALILTLLLSACLSIDPKLSFYGSNEQFEPFPILIAYLILMIGTENVIRRKEEIRLVFHALSVGAVLLSLCGFIQYIHGEAVSATLYNPNYVGTYASLTLPIFIFVSIYYIHQSVRKKDGIFDFLKYFRLLCSNPIKRGTHFLIAAVLLTLLLFLSGSIAGIIGIVFGIILGLGLLLRKKSASFLIIMVIMTSGILILITHLWNQCYVNHSENTLEISTEDRFAVFCENGKILRIAADYYEGGADFEVTDGNGNSLYYEGNLERNTYVLTDSGYANYCFNPIELPDGEMGFMVQCSGRQWYFGQEKDGRCRVMNAYGRLTDLKNASYIDSFSGHEGFLSGRGYIWSRTLPLVPAYLWNGSGPDTFGAVFPQNDVGKLLYTDFQYQDLILKPHSLYLQIMIQLGLPSFLLIFGVIFFTIKGIVRFVKRPDSDGNLFSIYAASAAAASLTAFLITSLVNDSTICVTPVAALLIGASACFL